MLGICYHIVIHQAAFIPALEHLNIGISFPHRDKMARGRVTKRAQDSNSNPSGTDNTNHILDTRCCVVQFKDEKVAKLVANVIASNK